MGKVKEPGPVRLFMSIIASDDELLHRGIRELCHAFGEVDSVSERFPFDFTDYYREEMGAPLFRRWITFGPLIPMSRLPEIKHVTNRLEEKFGDAVGNRRLNIDPGYLCLEHVILATTKGYTHRPYLRDGIYADLTLIYRNKSYQALEWTYPDYRQDKVIQLFNQWRRKYAEDAKGGKQQPC